MLYIDLEDPYVLKHFSGIFIRTITKLYASNSDTTGTYDYKKFLKEVRAFFIWSAKYLQTAMSNLKNDVIKSLKFLRLPERHQSTLEELYVLMQKFQTVITDINAFEWEFLECQATPDSEVQAYNIYIYIYIYIYICMFIYIPPRYIKGA